MRAWLRSPPQRIAAMTVTVVLFGVGFIPLFGGPDYEYALAAGLVLPSAAAIATALDVHGRPGSPLALIGRGALSGAVLAFLAGCVAVAHGLRTGFCDAREGFAFFALGPGIGAVMGGLWGASVSMVATAIGRGPGLAALLALLGPLGGVIVSVLRFYTSPMVFAFDPFAGFFAGTLYDTVITGLERLLTYRAGSALTILGLTVFAAHLRRGPEGRLGWRWPHPGVTALGALAAVGSVIHATSGTVLGHYQTEQSIRRALGHFALSERCEILYSSSIRKRDAHAVARECDAHVRQLEDYFGVEAPRRTTVFVFDSAEHKGQLMGAARVFIAKPWREEIYIQTAGFPHRVLRHELAHVVAGRFGQGLFDVAGPLGGLIPDPGRIEGVAVAAAPPEDDLGLQQWAAAMKRLDLLPRLDGVFRLSFLGEPASRAYTVAGAFLAWFHETYGPDAVRSWYGGTPIHQASGGKQLGALERDWHATLDALDISDETMHVARARFDRPTVFARRCPHTVDRLRERAGHLLGRNDADRARARYGEILEFDPHSVDAKFGLAVCALRDGKTEEALALYEGISSESDLPRSVKAGATERMADVLLATGRFDEAQKLYDRAAKAIIDEDHLRALDVKRYAAANPDGRAAIIAYLIGDPKQGRDETVAAAQLGIWSAQQPKVGLADYLLARNLYNSGRWTDAAAHLDRARSRKLPLERVRREALRTRLVLACAFGDRQGVGELWRELSKDARLPASRRGFLEGFVERCRERPGKDDGATTG